MILKPKAVMFLATGAHVGRIPFASGTFGSLVGFPFVYLFSLATRPVAALLTAVLILFSVWVAHLAEQLLKAKDPGCIVIDEIAGMCVTMFSIPLSLTNGAAGFFLFRLFDVIKPPPARQMERRLKGGWGVVMDDVVAGVMANIVLQLGLWFHILQ
jgi:phosphatidylglycerophosphatase A